jgi:hypothetical protein
LKGAQYDDQRAASARRAAPLLGSLGMARRTAETMSRAAAGASVRKVRAGVRDTTARMASSIWDSRTITESSRLPWFSACVRPRREERLDDPATDPISGPDLRVERLMRLVFC